MDFKWTSFLRLPMDTETNFVIDEDPNARWVFTRSGRHDFSIVETSLEKLLLTLNHLYGVKEIGYVLLRFPHKLR